MAQVDFSNAVLSPLQIGSYVPLDNSYIGLWLSNSIVICDSNKTQIASASISKAIDVAKNFLVIFSGTFTASGTELYLKYGTGSGDNMWWKITNISFNSGDTFIFQINATLTCN